MITDVRAKGTEHDYASDQEEGRTFSGQCLPVTECGVSAACLRCPTAMVICSMCRGQRYLGKRQNKIVLSAEESEVQSRWGHNAHRRNQRPEVKNPGRRPWMQKDRLETAAEARGVGSHGLPQEHTGGLAVWLSARDTWSLQENFHLEQAGSLSASLKH